MKKAFLILCLAALGLGILGSPQPRVVHAESGAVGEPNSIAAGGYYYDRQTAAFRSSIAVADTTTKANIIALPAFRPRGRQTISVGARMSASAATVSVRLVYITLNAPGVDTTSADNTIKDYSPIVTLTAGSTQYEGSYYVAPLQPFDSAGAQAVRLIVTTAPSSGTVDFWVGSY